MDELYYAMSILFFASFMQGIIGFGSGMISMSLLSLFWPVAYSTAVLNPLGLFLSSSLLWQQRNSVSFTSIKPLVLGLPLGIVTGLLALNQLSDVYLKLLLGLTLLLAVANKIWRKAEVQHLSRAYGWLAGVLSGVSGVCVSASGPPVLVYATMAGWDKDEFRANLSAFFLSASSLACVGLLTQGLMTLDTLNTTACLIPMVLLGSRMGFYVGQWIPQLHFTRFTLVLLSLLALRFIVATIA